MFIPQMMGERTPDWNPSRFGGFCGLAGSPTRGELYRAILESVAFDLLRHETSINQAGIRQSNTMLVSGITARSKVYREILANVTGYRVVYAARSGEAPGGDALIAAIACIAITAAITPIETRGRARPANAVIGKHFERVLIIVLENQDYRNAIKDPYLARLAREGVSFTNFSALSHPSYPNYLGMIAGSSFGVQSDRQINFPDDNGHETIADLLDWRCYAENYPETPKPFLGDLGRYARKHVPFLSFEKIQRDGAENIVSVNPGDSNNHFVTDIENFKKDPAKNPLPRYMFYTPNLDDDGHDPGLWPSVGLKKASRWLDMLLGQWMPLDDKMKGTLLVVTFDESQGDEESNQIYTVFLGDMVKRGEDGKPYNHYSVLKTIEDNFGLSSLQDGDRSAEPITGIWK
jgi:hypothetical protein